jgi:hypothetical protein
MIEIYDCPWRTTNQRFVLGVGYGVTRQVWEGANVLKLQNPGLIWTHWIIKFYPIMAYPAAVVVLQLIQGQPDPLAGICAAVNVVFGVFDYPFL